MVNMTMGHQLMMVNASELQKLPADVRSIFLAKVREWTPKYGKMSEEGENAARQDLKAHKVNLVTPTADDRSQAKTMMRPMWDAWASKNGAVGKELEQSAMKACGAS
jgi:TRAP-type C4-dicarboxylate transport system substrate-binding protein